MEELAQIKLLLVRGVLTPYASETRRRSLHKQVEVATTRDYDSVDFEQAVEKGLHIGGRCHRWIQEKGFGFCLVGGRTIFVHAGAIRFRAHLAVNGRVVLKVIHDPSRGDDCYKAIEAWLEKDFEAEAALVASQKAAQNAERAAKVAAETAAAAVKSSDHLATKVRTARVLGGTLHIPPGLDVKAVPMSRMATFQRISAGSLSGRLGVSSGEKSGSSLFDGPIVCSDASVAMRKQVLRKEVAKIVEVPPPLSLNEIECEQEWVESKIREIYGEQRAKTKVVGVVLQKLKHKSAGREMVLYQLVCKKHCKKPEEMQKVAKTFAPNPVEPLPADATPCKSKDAELEYTPGKVAAKNEICEMFDLYKHDVDDGDDGSYEDNDGRNYLLSKLQEMDINVVSSRVGRRVSAYVEKHGLDEKVPSQIMDCSDHVAEEVIATELSNRVRNPSAYVTRVVRDKVREGMEKCDGSFDEGVGQEAEGERRHNHEDDGGQEAYIDTEVSGGAQAHDDAVAAWTPAQDMKAGRTTTRNGQRRIGWQSRRPGGGEVEGEKWNDDQDGWLDDDGWQESSW